MTPTDSVGDVSNPLLRPRWILLHIGLATLVGTMAFLGFWQMDRRDQKREFNSTVIARTTQPSMPLTRMVTASSTMVDDLEWRPITTSGRYLPEESVTIINRSLDGTAGYSPLSALLLDTGDVVYVNRGFVPLAEPRPPTPEGQVEIRGFIRLTQTRGALGAVDSTDPATTEFHRIDLALIGQRLDRPVLPVYVQLIDETPPRPTTWPSPVGIPDLDEGPHFSYAFQWWFFSLVALAGWIVVARRALKTPDRSPARD